MRSTPLPDDHPQRWSDVCYWHLAWKHRRPTLPTVQEDRQKPVLPAPWINWTIPRRLHLFVNPGAIAPRVRFYLAIRLFGRTLRWMRTSQASA